MDRTKRNIVPLLLFNCCLADRAENVIPLLFAGRCTAAYLVVAAYQRVYMSQYIYCSFLGQQNSKFW
jgi:hypothetical protein